MIDIANSENQDIENQILPSQDFEADDISDIEDIEDEPDTEGDSNFEEVSDSKEIDENATTEIVGIRFKKNGKTYYFAPAGFVLNRDDRVIVDTSRGEEYGYTAVPNRQIKNKDIVEPLRAVIRMATANDTEIHKENLRKEVEAFNTCIALIDQHKLEMKLIDVEYSFDRTKLLFYFSAEGRIDFRELVKDLASVFHVRIEMRQIGIRDEAKILGGLGTCGRPYCCSTFLSDFGQVSVKMAKEQNLSLNSAKISGACGRLMCCLRYEYDTYLKEKALTPKVDTRVMTPSGAGIITAANPLAGIVKVKLDSMPDDADQVFFVREDVVNEADYDGRKLTQTALPQRNHGVSSKNEFVSAEVIENIAVQAPVEKAESQNSNSNTPEQTARPAQDEQKNQKQLRRDKDKNRRQDKKNVAAKTTNDNNAKENVKETQNEPQKEKSGQNKQQNQHRKARPQGNQNFKNANKSADAELSQASADVAETIAEEFGEKEAKADAQRKKKKPFKPYYRNFKKKKPSNNGGNS